MNELDNERFLQYAKSINSEAKIVFMDPKSLVFEENVKMNCFYCGKYGNNWRCPPNLPDIDFKKMFEEFDEGAFVHFSYNVDDRNYDFVRNDSSIVLHKMLLELEKWMWNNDRSTAISFTAGSCKLCRGGCGKDKCNNPYMSRSPLEATGINVLKSVKKYGVDIKFPTNKILSRTGLIVWQNRE